MNNDPSNRRDRRGRRDSEELDELTEAITGSAMEVHRALGPGLLESTYEMSLCRELSIRGLRFGRQVPIPVESKRVKLDCGYRAEVVPEESVLVEIKAVDSMLPIHDAQLLSYLKLGGWKIGLLINFNVALLKHGLRRRVLGLVEELRL